MSFRGEKMNGYLANELYSTWSFYEQMNSKEVVPWNGSCSGCLSRIFMIMVLAFFLSKYPPNAGLPLFFRAALRDMTDLGELACYWVVHAQMELSWEPRVPSAARRTTASTSGS